MVILLEPSARRKTCLEPRLLSVFGKACDTRESVLTWHSFMFPQLCSSATSSCVSLFKLAHVSSSAKLWNSAEAGKLSVPLELLQNESLSSLRRLSKAGGRPKVLSLRVAEGRRLASMEVDAMNLFFSLLILRRPCEVFQFDSNFSCWNDVHPQSGTIRGKGTGKLPVLMNLK